MGTVSTSTNAVCQPIKELMMDKDVSAEEVKEDSTEENSTALTLVNDEDEEEDDCLLLTVQPVKSSKSCDKDHWTRFLTSTPLHQANSQDVIDNQNVSSSQLFVQPYQGSFPVLSTQLFHSSLFFPEKKVC